MARRQLSICEKQEIIDFYTSRKGIKGAKIQTIKKFNLKGHSSLDAILANESKFAKSDFSLDKKRLVFGKFKELDDKVFDWVSKARNLGKSVPGYAIMEKAALTAEECGLKKFSASRGWLCGFKKRYGLRYKRLHGEAASVDASKIVDWIKENHSTLKNYKDEDIINIDETTLFYNQINPSSFVLKHEKDVRGKKLLKNRVTLLVSASLSGEKLPLIVIGKFKNPRCFKGIKKFPVDYYSQSNSWMTAGIFYQIMSRLNNKLLLEKRKVLIILDQSPTHPKGLDCFSQIQFLFLPKNTTSCTQPLDLGIIHSLKCHYRKILCRHLLTYEENAEPKYTLLDCITTLEKAWVTVSAETIINCFRKSKIFNNGNETLSENVEEIEADFIEIENLEYNTPVCEIEESLSSSITSEKLPKNEEDDEILEKVTINDMKKALNTLRFGFMARDPAGLFDLHPVMDRVSYMAMNNFHQSNITDFFKKPSKQ